MKNNLTNDMSRLRGEIAELRDCRSEASEALRQDVSQLLAGFRRARAALSQQTKAQLHDTILHIKESVTELRQSCFELRRSFQNDITGARQAWCGVGVAPAEEPVPAEPSPREKKKKR